MANELQFIEVINNITWQDLVENSDLLKLDTKYAYPLASGVFIPDVDYPAGNLNLGKCVDPNEGTDNVVYPYDIVVLGNYVNSTASFNVYDELGNEIAVYNPRVIYALFWSNPNSGEESISYCLVKATDTININYDYIWFPVASWIDNVK